MSPRHRTLTPIEPYEDPKVRAAWASLRPESLTGFASRVGMTARQVKHDRQLHADGFPEHVPIDGKYMASMMVFSGDLLDLWFEAGYDLRTAPAAKLAKVRERIAKAVELVRPVTMAVVSPRLVPSMSDDAALRRVRTWRDSRDVTGFPMPLEFDAGSTGSHLFASMIYSGREIEAWFADFSERFDVNRSRRVARRDETAAAPAAAPVARRAPRPTSKQT